MIKEFNLNDILNAVNNISRIDRNKKKIEHIKKNSNDSVDKISINNQIKSDDSEILVLDQMID
jgi:hypothetical protein